MSSDVARALADAEVSEVREVVVGGSRERESRCEGNVMGDSDLGVRGRGAPSGTEEALLLLLPSLQNMLAPSHFWVFFCRGVMTPTRERVSL